MAYKYVAYDANKKIAEGIINVNTKSMAVELLGHAGYRVASLKSVKSRRETKRSKPATKAEEAVPFKYIAYDANKRIVEGTISVTNERTAVEALERLGYRVISLRAAKSRLWKSLPLKLFGINAQHVVLFSRQLAMLLETGTTLITALQLLRDRTTSGAFRRIITAVIRDVEAGASFSEAVARHPHVFTPVYNRMMKVGEQAGNLEVVLKEMSDYMERGQTAKNRVARAMIYPAFLMVLAIGAVAFLITVALPPMMEMLTELETGLPFTTKVLIAIIDFITGYKFYLLGAIFALVVLIACCIIQPVARREFDKLLLKLPLIGPINVLHHLSHFARTTSMLFSAGLAMPEIMEVVMQTSGNEIVREAVRDVRKGLIQGQGLSKPMSANKLFPPVLTQIVMVGEETDTLTSNLATLADSYEYEIGNKINTLTSMIGPCLILFIGLAVAFIASSVVMPIYTIYSSLG